MDKVPSQYTGLPCTHPGCYCPKTHATENCWANERETCNKEKEKSAKYKAKKAKKGKSNSDSETGSGSDLEDPPSKKCHHANQSQVNSTMMLRTLKASTHLIHTCHGKTMAEDVFIAHLDSGVLNHMTHKLELLDLASFEKLSTPIPISLGDDSEVFATGKGTLRLLFNVDGKKEEGSFKDVLFVPDLKVTLLSIGQSARLPHCKVVQSFTSQ